MDVCLDSFKTEDQSLWKVVHVFAFQNHLSPLPHLSLPPWGRPTCGYSSMPTPSMGTGPLSPERWSIARQVGAGMTGSRWIPQVIKLGTSTRIQSMRSACSSPGRERVALGPPDQLSGREPSVPVSGADLRPHLSFCALTCSMGV